MKEHSFTLNVAWSCDKDRVVANVAPIGGDFDEKSWLAINGQYRNPDLTHDQRILEIEQMGDGEHWKLFSGDLPGLIAAAFARQNGFEVEMTFSISATKMWPKGDWYNTVIRVTWEGHDGSERYGEIRGFNVKRKTCWCPGPSWNSKGKWTPMMYGRLRELFASMAIWAAQNAAHDAGIIIGEATHNATGCSKCALHYTKNYGIKGTSVIHGCLVNSMHEFSTADITPNDFDHCGITLEGGNKRSQQADARWAYEEVKDTPLSKSDFRRIGEIIDAKDGIAFNGVAALIAEATAPIFDDLLVIDHIARSGLDSIEDLDEAVVAYREAVTLRAQRHYARLFPEYEDVFMNRSALSDLARNVSDKFILPGERSGEMSHKVRDDTFLDTYIMLPCTMGFSFGKEWAVYHWSGYEIRVGRDALQDMRDHSKY